MNQTEFAEQLNVTFATVNRWENGRALPNKLAQDKIYDLCKEHDVPVYDIVLDKIEIASRSIELEKGRKLLYHGSKSGIVGDIAPKSRKQCDFGEGFYMGTDPSQALTLICDYDKYQKTTKNKDLVIGSIANDRMFFVIDNFFIGNITDAALINCLSALELGKQYVAVTQKGCDAVRIEKEIPISYLEKKLRI